MKQFNKIEPNRITLNNQWAKTIEYYFHQVESYLSKKRVRYNLIKFYRSINKKYNSVTIYLNSIFVFIKPGYIQLNQKIVKFLISTKRVILQTEKRIFYKKDGILVIKEENNKQKMQFIRIATISLPEELPYVPFTNKRRTVFETQLNKFRDSLNNSVITREKYISGINKIRGIIPIRYPLSSRQDLNNYVKVWRDNKEVDKISTNLDNLIKQGVEVQYVAYNTKRDYIQSLIILIDYGPLFPSHYSKKQVINRPSILDIHCSLKNYKKIVYLNSEHRIELLKYRKSSHPQLLSLKKDLISKLFHQSSSSIRKTTKSSGEKALSTIGRLSNYPDNCILSISSKRSSDRYINPKNYTGVKYLNLSKNRSLHVVADNKDFNRFIQSYIFMRRNKQDGHKVLIFSNKQWPDFQKIGLDDLRLSLIQLNTNHEMKEFIFIYMAIDLLFGDKQETGSSDMLVLFKEIMEYDKTLLKSIHTIDGFLEILARQLTNQSYLGKTRTISKIYQVFRQFNLRRILDPKEDGLISIEGINNHVHFLTDKSSSESFLSLFLIIFKIAQKRHIDRDCLEEITIVVDDPGIIRILSDRQNYTYFSKLILNLKDLRLIFHGDNSNQHSAFTDIPKLVLNERDSQLNRSYSTLHLGTSMKIDVNQVLLEEVSV